MENEGILSQMYVSLIKKKGFFGEKKLVN